MPGGQRNRIVLVAIIVLPAALGFGAAGRASGGGLTADALARQSTTQPATRPASRPASRPAENRGNSPADRFDHRGSDPRAIEIADRVMAALGGHRAWDSTRYLTWRFFGDRRHLWDRKNGDLRIEKTGQAGESVVIIMNLHTVQGRVFSGGQELTDPEKLKEMLEDGRRAWINDSYWLLMPYKLKDKGVTLRYLGEAKTLEGSAAQILQLTFTGVGVTPQNKYHVYVGRETGLVEQWDFYRDKTDEKPVFKVPWRDWKRYGRIMISGDRGESNGKAARLTDIAVFDELPASVFDSAEDVDWNQLIGD